MRTARNIPSPRAAVALLAVLWLAAPARPADDDATLRQRALALNDVTGSRASKGQILALTKDPAATKKLLAVAVQVAKEKEQPFRYNAAAILAETAFQLKAPEAARVFYRLCGQEALKLRSDQRLIEAYIGLLNVIDQFYDGKQFAESASASQEFLELLDKQRASPALKAQALRRLVRGLVGQGKVDEATKVVDGLLKSQKNNWHVLDLKGDLLLRKGDKAEAAKVYEEVLKQLAKDRDLSRDGRDRQLTEILRKVLRVAVEQGKNDEAISRVEEFLKGQKNSWRALDLKGDLLREAGQYDAAAKTYEDVLRRVAESRDLDEDEREREVLGVRYLLSSVYVDLKQIDKASEHLKALLAKQPDDPTFNNDLGFIWADHDMNLAEAEKLIRKALDADRKQRKANEDLKPEQDKDNAAYLDSLGWVLFKQKRYQEAKPFLLQAVKDSKEGQHLEIYDHLGDIHRALGEKAEALAAYQKGLKHANKSKRDQQRKVEVEKKVKALQP